MQQSKNFISMTHVTKNKDAACEWLTTKRCVRTSLQVHFTVSPLAHGLEVVADAVAAVLPAAQTDALLEAIGAGTLEGIADVVLVHKGVHEEMYRPFVLALHDFNEICVVEKAC